MAKKIAKGRILSPNEIKNGDIGEAQRDPWINTWNTTGNNADYCTDFLGYLMPLRLLQICGISGKVPVRHFIAVPYIIDRIDISGF